MIDESQQLVPLPAPTGSLFKMHLIPQWNKLYQSDQYDGKWQETQKNEKNEIDEIGEKYTLENEKNEKKEDRSGEKKKS